MSKIVIFIALLGILTISCDSQRVYEKNLDFDDIFWNSDSVQSFEFEIKESQFYHNVYFNVRTSIAYPFQNIYVGYWLEDMSGNVLETNSSDLNNLVDIQIFDAKSGKPLGDGLGDLVDFQVPILEEYAFKTPGTYRIKFQHFMRVEDLPGVLSVGARVETVEVE